MTSVYTKKPQLNSDKITKSPDLTVGAFLTIQVFTRSKNYS